MKVETQPIKNKPGHFRVMISKSVREGSKVKRKIVRYFGIARDAQQLEQITRFATSCLDSEIAREKNCELLFDASEELYCQDLRMRRSDLPRIDEVKEEKRIVDGPKEIFGTLFDEVVGDVLPKEQNALLKDIVSQRISNPTSKLKTSKTLSQQGDEETNVQSVYRMMDKLFQVEEIVKSRIFSASKTLLNGKIDVLFFDVTTLYMESISEDELRAFGYSKDQKFHQVQVVLALATTADGLPIGYKLCPGNTAETKTLLACIDEWEKSFQIGKIVIVADAAMFSFANLQALAQRGYEFVVSARLKSLNRGMKDIILRPTCYRIMQASAGDDLRWVKEIPYAMERKKERIIGRLITTYSSGRAKKDQKDRQRILDRLRKKLGDKKASAKKIVSNSGYLKYTKIDDLHVAEIDESKVSRDAEWDGFHGVFTNSKRPIAEILCLYRRLWVIEESFRINKHNLEMRPMYHFAPRRIRAHILICFIAFALLRHLMFRLGEEKDKEPLSPQTIVEELNRVQSSILKDRHSVRYRLPSIFSDTAKRIYAAVGLKRRHALQRL
jgi:transposase